jgi:hypothetical protein
MGTMSKLRIRPSNPYGNGHLHSEDFFTVPDRTTRITLGKDIWVDTIFPISGTIVLGNPGFCVVPRAPWDSKRKVYPKGLLVCLPYQVFDRKILFISPNITNQIVKEKSKK